MDQSLSNALGNLTSVSVLVFILGFIAARFKSDIRIPDPVYQIISVYLLFGIGLKGGVSLRHSTVTGLAKPVVATLILGCIIPALAFFLLKFIKSLSEIDRGAIAAHYGSTSLVTFTAALVFLDNAKIEYEGFATALLTIMEIPGIIIGIFLATRHLNRQLSWSISLKEIVLGKTIILLVGGLVVGAISGDAGYARVEPFFVNLLPGILALFLMHLGYLAGQRIHVIKETGAGLFAFAILFPLISGSLGVLGGYLAGLSVGGATVLGVLSASASYIAAPAAVGIALPEANPSLSITSSLGITFPFNLTVGIPIFYTFAQALIG
ncbi:MAG: sodium-dependent bicarbonate transport family permease [Actinobacteria bacterium]|nr:sodium-dependent bicarbonate transport family permease [Actinomycetota bacterium]